MLPTGALYHPTDGAVTFLGYARIRAGNHLRFADGWPTIALREDVFTVYTGLGDKEGLPLLDTVLNSATSPHVGDAHVPGQHAIPAREGFYELPIAEDESRFLQQCRSIVFSLLLTIEVRPTILAAGRRVGVHPKSKREIWEPNIVGRGYRVIRAQATEAAAHASPRTHWRRGHFRQQPHGPDRAQIKTIWIEPTLVGLNEST